LIEGTGGTSMSQSHQVNAKSRARQLFPSMP